mmetsp:Transcript_49980/g.113170  ORF Transcript_49980/g.113170 Transcript_49980/m.113170 type:complete len:203 (-) Transcript_49980:54-662(-)
MPRSAVASGMPDESSQLPREARSLGVLVCKGSQQQSTEVSGPGAAVSAKLGKPPLPHQVLLERLPCLVALRAHLYDLADAIRLGVRPEPALQLLDAIEHRLLVLLVLSVCLLGRRRGAARVEEGPQGVLQLLQILLLGWQHVPHILHLFSDGRDNSLHPPSRGRPEKTTYAHQGEGKVERCLPAKGRLLRVRTRLAVGGCRP